MTTPTPQRPGPRLDALDLIYHRATCDVLQIPTGEQFFYGEFTEVPPELFNGEKDNRLLLRVQVFDTEGKPQSFSVEFQRNENRPWELLSVRHDPGIRPRPREYSHFGVRDHSFR